MNPANDTSRFTPITAILAAVLALGSLVSYLFWPDVLQAGGADFYLGILHHTTLFRFTYLAFALSALAASVLVLAMWDLLRWRSLLGVVGYSVIALHFFAYQNEVVRIAEAYTDQAGSYEAYGIYLGPTSSGQLLVALFPPESAGESGFEKGAVLTAVNGRAISRGSTLQEVWDGSEVTVTLRDADGAQREVVLDSGPQSYWNLDAQQAISAVGEPALDRNFMFGFGLVGLWLVAINWLAWRWDAYPRILALIGVGAGLAYWAFAAGNQFGVGVLGQAGPLVGLVLLPAWLVWTGMVLRRLGPAAAESQ